MTQEEKQLLFKDLCARLPYGVMIQYHEEYDWTPVKLHNISKYTFNDTYNLEKCKPYLRPISSMTDEETKEYNNAIDFDTIKMQKTFETKSAVMVGVYALDYLLSHYFDFRGLIEKGLALEAPDDMYKTE